MLLVNAWKEARNIDERDEWDVERIAEPDEPCGFDRCVDIESACKNRWLVRNNSNGVSVESSKTDNDVASPVFVDLVELAVVDDAFDDIYDAVRLVR